MSGQATRRLAGVAAGMALALVPAAAARADVAITDVPSVSEGSSATYTISRACDVLESDSLSVDVQTVAGTAAVPDDVSSPSPATVSLDCTFGVASTADVQVSTVADGIDEDDETYSVTATPADGTPPATTSTTIVDGDPTPTLSIGATSATEGTSVGGTLRFPLTLSGPSSRFVTADYALAGDTATAGQDFDATGGSVGIPAGQTTGTLVVHILPDADDEPDETLTATLSAPAFATLGTAAAQGTILDDDLPPSTVAQDPGLGGSTADTPPLSAAPATTTPGPTTPVSTSSPATVAGPKVRLTALRTTRTTMRTTVTCPRGSGGCKGTVTVFTVPDRRSRSKLLRREVRAGSGRFTLAAGSHRQVSIRVSRTVRTALQRAHHVKVTAYAVARDAAGDVGTAQSSGALKG